MAGQNNFFPDPSASFTYLYNRNGNYDNSYPVYVYGSCPENSDRFHWRYFGKEQQSQASRSSSPRSSTTPIEEPSKAGSLTELSESSKKKGKKYGTWSRAQKRLLQFWAENLELLESRASQTALRKICEDVSPCMETSETIETSIKNMKYLTDRYKEANEWNRKQSGGSKKQSLFYHEIYAVLGCRDIVTLTHVSKAETTGTQASSSPTSL